jgi:hypothetical protein
VILCLVLLSFIELNAGVVRKVYSDGVAMIPVNLRMGQSTVLRFIEKPKQVVLGNSNYYSVEFIENDVAIKPLRGVTTNLFVYGIKNVYGFLLRTNQFTDYDDLVEVDLVGNKLVAQTKVILKPLLFKEVSRPNIVFYVAKNLKVTISRLQKLEQRDFYLFDLLIENTSKNEIDLSAIEIYLSRGKFKLSPQEFILQQSVIKAGSSTKARVFVSIHKRTDLSLGIGLKDLKTEQIISGKLL